MYNLKKIKSNISFNAQLFWHSNASRRFIKDFPELKNILKHHMGGNNVIHYIQYGNDIFILTSAKAINNSHTNSITTGKIGCGQDEIKKIFREHFNKFKTLNSLHKPEIIMEEKVNTDIQKSNFKSILGKIVPFFTNK